LPLAPVARRTLELAASRPEGRYLKDGAWRARCESSNDGAPCLIDAIERAYPRALRPPCLIHWARNILAKTPVGMQAEAKDAYWKVFDTGERAPSRQGGSLLQISTAGVVALGD